MPNAHSPIDIHLQPKYSKSVHIMKTVPIKEARANLSRLIDLAEQGETVVITRNGKESAQLCPVPHDGSILPSLEAFRATIGPPPTGLSETVIAARKDERF